MTVYRVQTTKPPRRRGHVRNGAGMLRESVGRLADHGAGSYAGSRQTPSPSPAGPPVEMVDTRQLDRIASHGHQTLYRDFRGLWLEIRQPGRAGTIQLIGATRAAEFRRGADHA